MGRGSSNQALETRRHPRQLLFGPRGLRAPIDLDKAVASALNDLEDNYRGPALVILRRFQNDIGQDQRIDSLMAAVTQQVIVSNLPEDNNGGRNIIIRPNADAEPVSFDDDEAEVSNLIDQLGDSMKEKIINGSDTIDVDRDQMIEILFSADKVGSLSARMLAEMEDNDHLYWAYRLGGSGATIPATLRSNLASSLLGRAETDARQFASLQGIGGRYADKVTYLRRGGRHATLLHLINPGSGATLCGKSLGYYRNSTPRGAWRDAPSSAINYKRCTKCVKVMPEDFFDPAEEDQDYSLLDRDQYNRALKKAQKKADQLMSGTKSPTVLDMQQAADELREEIIDTERRAIAQKLHDQISGASDDGHATLSNLRQMIGYSYGYKMASKLDWDWDKFKAPTARQFHNVLKHWPDQTDSDFFEEELAKMVFRVNGKTLPKLD